MLREKEICIDCKCFASLILDYEFFDYVSCRVLVEDLLRGYIVASNRAEAIEKFRAGLWEV